MPWVKNLRSKGSGHRFVVLAAVIPGFLVGRDPVDESIQRETAWFLEQIRLGNGGYLARPHRMSDECC
jgi:hypothetical protein